MFATMSAPASPLVAADPAALPSDRAAFLFFHQQHHARAPSPMDEPRIWIITGPAGCGKSTVAGFLAQRLGLPFIEGDDANIDKMSQGVPLTDADRWGWLGQLRDQALHTLASGAPGAVVTCSALKRRYRDVIRDAPAAVRFVYLRVSEATLLERVRARRGHYMKDDMVHSQLESLEEPAPDEADCIYIDVEGRSQEQVCAAAIDAVAAQIAAQVSRD